MIMREGRTSLIQHQQTTPSNFPLHRRGKHQKNILGKTANSM